MRFFNDPVVKRVEGDSHFQIDHSLVHMMGGDIVSAALIDFFACHHYIRESDMPGLSNVGYPEDGLWQRHSISRILENHPIFNPLDIIRGLNLLESSGIIHVSKSAQGVPEKYLFIPDIIGAYFGLAGAEWKSYPPISTIEVRVSINKTLFK